jgi:hypothetical protein
MLSVRRARNGFGAADGTAEGVVSFGGGTARRGYDFTRCAASAPVAESAM